jgi:spore coat polysaccharide biosynthesis protein SpsF
VGETGLRTVAIVQARMGSSRLPGKSLMPVAGQPMLFHVLQRLGASRKLDDIVVATSNVPRDQVIVDLAREAGVETFSGSETDVLDRYYGAAKAFGAGIVVRVTGDCPLIDPVIVDEVVSLLLESSKDYCVTSGFPRGLDTEAFLFSALERAWREARRDYEREHVTPYIYRHREKFSVREFDALAPLHRPELRLCVDTEEDLALIRKIFARLYVPPGRLFATEEVIALLDSEPRLRRINAHVAQKTLPVE